MQLDIKERLQLSYQLKILEKLYPEEKDYYANHRKAIEDGYELHYTWITEHLSDGLSSEECTFVLDVLDMYASFHYSFLQIEKPTKLTLSKVKFPGFDGNHETMYMAYTKYFIEDLDRFGEIKETTNGYYNSHSEMIPKYRKMLLKWKQFKIDYSYKLTEEQVSELIDIHVY
ncbi:YfbU family protein [Rufibacter hautae]|nr:YfbU family protein [Rufibacter hautae]